MSIIQQTIINHDIGRPVIGYMLNATFRAKEQKEIATLQQKIAERFGSSIWITPPATLHITLMDWIAPLVDYGKSKEGLFEELFPAYDAVFTRLLKDFKQIKINFNEVKATPGAIIILGQDNGEFNNIRSRFLEEVQLLPNTKQPPVIIHSTIARYRKEMDLNPIISFLAQHPVMFTYEVSRFRLVRENTAPQLKYQLLKEYPLV